MDAGYVSETAMTIRVVRADGGEVMQWVGETAHITGALQLAAMDAEDRQTWGYYEAFYLDRPAERARIVAWCFEDESEYRARVMFGALPQAVSPVQGRFTLAEAA